MLIARTIDGLEGAILIHPDGTVVLSGGGGIPPVTTSVWSASDAAANGMTLSNGGLTVTSPAIVGFNSIRGTISKSSGKLYLEWGVGGSTNGNGAIGVANATFNAVHTILGSSNYSGGMAYAQNVLSAGFTSNYTNASPWPSSGDTWSMAIDFTAGKIWLAHNNVWLNSSDPASGSLPIISFVPATVGALFPAVTTEDIGEIWTLQSTAANQKYAPPSGFSAWDAPVAPPTSVWSSSDAAIYGMTLSNGGLTVLTTPTGINKTIRTTIGKTSGKLYVEFFINSTDGATYEVFGLASSGFDASSYLGTSPYSSGISLHLDNYINGFTSNYTLTATLVNSDVIALAVDFTAGNVWIARNNVWANTSNPATGVLPILSFVPATVGALFVGLSQFTPNTYTLQSTTASQRYLPPAGFTAWDGAGTHSPQALAYLARTVGGDEGGNGANISTLIDGLVSDGVWAKLDALYVLAQQNQTDALLNLVGTSYTLTGTLRDAPSPRALTFTSYVGFSGFVAGLNTGFDPTTAPSPHYTLNDAGFGVWTYAVIQEACGQIGQYVADDRASIYTKFSDGTSISVVNGGGYSHVASTITKGLFAAERLDAANIYPYQNGVSFGPIASISTSIISSPFTIGYVIANPTVQTLSAAFIGASLGAAGQLALYNRLKTYMDAIGPPGLGTTFKLGVSPIG